MKRLVGAALAVTVSGCSFIAVRGPVHTTETIQDPALVKCTESSLLPSLDAVAGVIAAGGSIFGTIVDQTNSSTHLPDHFTAYYAGPLLALGIAYLWSASFGTDRVEACHDAKAAVIPPAVVKPIDMTGYKPPPDAD
jgi:hypothetical protein